MMVKRRSRFAQAGKSDAAYIFQKLGNRSQYDSERPEIERRLVADMLAGDRDARDRLIESMMATVYDIGRRYAPFVDNLGDVIAVGAIGAIEGVDHFDPSVGTQLSTYAAYWIRKRIRDFVYGDNRFIKVERRKQKEIKPVVFSFLENYNFSEDSESCDLRRRIRDALNIEEDYERVDREIDAETILRTLLPREREIMELYFGFGDNDPKTLKAIGKRYRLTRQRIQQLKERILNRLRFVFAEAHNG